jgi:hypothetical protein
MELVEALSVKLIERTLQGTRQEFEADTNADESPLWALLMLGPSSKIR